MIINSDKILFVFFTVFVCVNMPELSSSQVSTTGSSTVMCCSVRSSPSSSLSETTCVGVIIKTQEEEPT